MDMRQAALAILTSYGVARGTLGPPEQKDAAYELVWFAKFLVFSRLMGKKLRDG